MGWKKLVPLALAALAGLSCRLPPFNESISLALLTASKMTKEAEVGPLELDETNPLKPEQIRFFPEKANFRQGFLLVDLGNPWLCYLPEALDAKANPFPEMFWYDNNDKRTLNYRAETLAGGSYLAHFNVRTMIGMPQTYLLNVLWFDGASIVKTVDNVNLKTVNAAVVPTIAELVGSSLFPASGPFFHQARFLWRNSTDSTLYHEIGWDLDATGMVNGIQPRPGFTVQLGAGLENVFYYYYPDAGVGGTGIASCSKDGAYRTLKWDNTNLPSPVELPFSERVEALLTNGLLFCPQDEAAYVYDLEGKRVARFPLGGLQLAYEMWDAGRGLYKLVFVLPYFIQTESGKELHFTVYSIPTDRVTHLD